MRFCEHRVSDVLTTIRFCRLTPEYPTTTRNSVVDDNNSARDGSVV